MKSISPTIMNTILLGGFMVSNIIYTSTNAEPLSVQGFIMFTMMLLFIGWNISLVGKFSSSDIFIAFGSILYFSGYLLFSDVSFSNIGLSLASILFFLTLQYARVDGRKIALGLIAFWLFSIGLYPVAFVDSFTATRVVDYFSGFFENSNTFAAYSAVTFFAAVIFVRSQRLRWCVAAVFFVMLFAHHSRNALLFALLTSAFYFLMKRGWYWLPPCLFSLIIGGALLFLVVIEPNQSVANFMLFGKKANTAGRSSQVLSIINHFDIKWFGEGAETITRYSIVANDYAVHNVWINTLYSMGIIYVILYAIFIGKVYKNLSPLAQSFLLGFHIYSFFEPGLFFSILMVSSFPIIIAIISQRKYENSTLYI